MWLSWEWSAREEQDSGRSTWSWLDSSEQITKGRKYSLVANSGLPPPCLPNALTGLTADISLMDQCAAQIKNKGFLKADSHIARRAHAVPLPRRAAKGLECVFPIWFTQCGHVWFTLATPYPCHPRPRRSSQGHGTAWPSRDALWANCQLSTSSSYHAEFHEVITRRPISDAGGQCQTKQRLHGRGKEW